MVCDPSHTCPGRALLCPNRACFQHIVSFVFEMSITVVIFGQQFLYNDLTQVFSEAAMPRERPSDQAEAHHLLTPVHPLLQ
ncbi:hypothetical protein EVAR_97996_1 [Eumeta japonica]|uniref:Uncharacterized protein n=1 Tax=Eumeta variegata TaxID=151549 RepID=A0A4C1WL03_EUMVA|nr:hypothetical protein EVAR_97996_1 [Eumeta japonica]